MSEERDTTVRQIFSLDKNHPWPGLRSFTEDNAAFFFGREQEIVELARIVRQEQMTVLFGRSGLGKSSLLRAGLSPLLRQSELMPVYIRLNHFEETLPLEDQVEVHFEKLIESEGIDAPQPIREETLWEYFHKKESNWWDQENRLIKPVLIFDQFEEVLTSGQQNPVRVARSAAFLTELEDLVENRPPAGLLERFKAEKGLAKNYDLERTDYRVVLALREDFLADFESLRSGLRQIMCNRFRLMPMNREQAQRVILQPGSHLVDEEVALQIVNFVSRRDISPAVEKMDRHQLMPRQVEPALLSVVLSELNNLRIKAGKQKITLDLIKDKKPTEILTDFYERGLVGLDVKVRDFIEQHLLTASGARNRVAEEDAINRHGVSERVISTLIDRRILQREKTGQMKWLELTHDTLTSVVRTSGEARQRKKRLQQIFLRVIFSLLFLFGLTVVGLFYQTRQRHMQAAEAGKLALDIARTVEQNSAMSSAAKQEMLEKLDKSFDDLRDFAKGSGQLDVSNAEFLVTRASIFFDDGYYHLASDCAGRAHALLFPQKMPAGLSTAPAATKIRVKLAVAISELYRAAYQSAHRTLDEAQAYFPANPSPMEDGSFERFILEQRLKRIRAMVLVDQRKLMEAGQLETQARTALGDFLANEEHADVEAGIKQVLFKEMYRLHKIRTGIYDILKIGDVSLFNSDFREDLDKGRGFFSGDSEPQWQYFHALSFITKGDMHFNDGEGDQALASYDFAVASLTELVRGNEDNLVFRYSLGRALLERSFFTKSNDRLQASVDVTAARSLGHTIQRDSPHPYLALKLNESADFQQGQLYSTAEGEDKSLAGYYRLLARVESNRDRFEEFNWLDDLALFGYYGLAVAYLKDDNSQKALENARSFLGLMDQLENRIGGSLYTATRRYYAYETMLASEADRLGEAVWHEFLQGAVDQLDFISKNAPGNRKWLTSKTYIYCHKGNSLFIKKQYVEAVRAFEEAIHAGLTALGTNPAEKVAAHNAIYATTRIIKSCHALRDWAGIVAAMESGHLIIRVKGVDQEIQHAADKLRYWRDTHEALQSAVEEANGDPNNQQLADYEQPREKSDDEQEPLARLQKALTRSQEVLTLLESLQNSQVKAGEMPASDESPSLDLKTLDLGDLVTKRGQNQLEVSRRLGWSYKPIYSAPWVTLSGEDFEQAASMVPKDSSKIVHIRRTDLPFYRDGQLLDVEFIATQGNYVIKSYLTSPSQKPYLLNGTSPPIHEANTKLPIDIQTSEDAAAYLRFFTTYVQGKDGSFQLVETLDELPWSEGVIPQRYIGVADLLRPVALWADPEKKDRWFATATVNYGDTIFHAKFTVFKTGLIQMDDDVPVAENLPLDLLKIKSGARTNTYAKRLSLELIDQLDLSATKDEVEALLGLAKQPDEKRPAHYLHLLADAMALYLVTIENSNESQAYETYKWIQNLRLLAGDEIPGLRANADKFINQAIEYQKKIVSDLEQEGQDPSEELPGEYLNLSWYQLHGRDFTGALASAKAGKEWDPSHLPLDTNLAHALLFLNRLEEAKQVYFQHMGKPLAGKTWQAIILDDFDQFEQWDITHPEMTTIRFHLRDKVPPY